MVPRKSGAESVMASSEAESTGVPRADDRADDEAFGSK